MDSNKLARGIFLSNQTEISKYKEKEKNYNIWRVWFEQVLSPAVSGVLAIRTVMKLIACILYINLSF